ncbi:unnamed protein product, partial [Staurois parvus]
MISVLCMISVAPAVPPVSANQCQLSVLFNASYQCSAHHATYQCLLVYMNATYQCPSELHFSVTYQCASQYHLSMPVSATYQCCQSVPVSAAYQ